MFLQVFNVNSEVMSHLQLLLELPLKACLLPQRSCVDLIDESCSSEVWLRHEGVICPLLRRSVGGRIPKMLTVN